MAAWVSAGGATIGIPPPLGELIALTPRQFHIEKNRNPWTVLLSADADGETRSLFSGQHIIIPDTAATTAAQVVALIGSSAPPSRNLLLVTPMAADQLAMIMQHLPDWRVRYLDGGAASYATFLDRRNALMSRSSQPLSTRKRCAG